MVKFVELKHKGGYIRGLHHINNSKKIVIFFHGFTGNKNESNFSFARQARLFDKNNIDSIRLDYYGNGDSDGEFNDMNFTDLIKQGNLIIDYVKTLNYDKIYLEGMSMGGALAIKLASPDIAKLVLISPAINMKKIVDYIFTHNKILPNGNADVRSLEFNKEFKRSIEDIDLFDNVVNLDIPTIIIQGTADLSVPYENAIIVNKKIKNSILVSVDDADHVYSSAKYMNTLFSNILDFVVN